MSKLSRLYRPQTFADISGQSQVIETLRREVEQSKLGHAYLFSGPRGVGKTTAARIFAKAINCTDPQKGEPCMKCDACKRIADNQAIDLIEIDAASHRGVTEVQESIIDHIKFIPANLKYKVYILDEAHMLTDHAWNALLKTVEEPPEYAVFIFATTERHKVPATIVSRCQRFEFSRISQQEIIARLKMLADKEKAKVDDEVLATIASKTEGCLRDAENLLGQLLSLGEKKITPDIAAIVIPPSQRPIAAELLELAVNSEIAKVLTRIDELEAQGVSFIPLFDDLITSTRDLLIAANVSKHADELQKGTEADKKLASLVSQAETSKLVQASHILMERRREAKHGIDPRFALELGLVAIATLGSTEAQTQTSESNFNKQKQTNEIKDDSLAQTVATQTLEVFDEPPQIKSEIRNTNSEIRIEDVQRVWPKFLQEFEDQKSLLFILKPAQIISVKNNNVFLKLQFAIHKKTLDNAQNKAVIQNKLANLLNLESIGVEGVIDDVVVEEPAQSKSKDTANSIIDAFGGELVN